MTDSGTGIPDADLPRVFDRFYRADPSRSRAVDGTGLGLAICRSITEAHGGHITVRNNAGNGCTVTRGVSDRGSDINPAKIDSTMAMGFPRGRCYMEAWQRNATHPRSRPPSCPRPSFCARARQASPSSTLSSPFTQFTRKQPLRQARAVNVSLTLRNWLIGSYIAEYELRGKDRAAYGEKLFDSLAAELSGLSVSNSNRRQLYRYLRFYRTYPA